MDKPLDIDSLSDKEVRQLLTDLISHLNFQVTTRNWPGSGEKEFIFKGEIPDYRLDKDLVRKLNDTDRSNY